MNHRGTAAISQYGVPFAAPVLAIHRRELPEGQFPVIEGAHLELTTGDEDTEMRLARRGDHVAFLSLVQRQDRSLRALVFRIVLNRHDMQDVMQETYIKAFRSIDRFDPRNSFPGWIHRIAYRAALDHLRRIARVVPIAPDMVAHALPPSLAEDDAVAHTNDLATALRNLSEPQRAAVLLVDALGFDYATAADILDVPPGTVASRLSTARSALRLVLGDYQEETDR